MATWLKMTGKNIDQCFKDFNKNNPEVYVYIEKECERAIKKGKKKFSIKQIIGWIRWEVFLETKEENLFSHRGEKKKFKINDAYTSRYSRLIIKKHPDWEPYIETRILRS